MTKAERDRQWDKIAEVVEPIRSGPPWMRAGVSLNPEHFETYDQWCGHISEPMRVGGGNDLGHG